MQELQPPRVLKSVTSSHLTATPRAVWTVEMHNVFQIGPAVRREFLTLTLSVEGCTDLNNIVHSYSMRVTKFCKRGGCVFFTFIGSTALWFRGLLPFSTHVLSANPIRGGHGLRV